MWRSIKMSLVLAAVLGPLTAPIGAAQISVRVLKGSELARVRSRLPNPAAVQRIRGKVVDTVAVSKDSLQLRIGEVYTFIAPQGPRGDTSAAGKHVDTPLRLVSLDVGGKARVVGISYAADAGGLHYDRAGDAFRGSVAFWLEDQDHHEDEYSLPHPVSISVFAEADSTSPPTLQLVRTGTAERVRLVSLAPEESIHIQLRPGAQLAPVTATVRVLPALRLRVAPRGIQGLGLEAATVSVQLLGDAERDSYTILVAPGRTAANPPELTLRRGETKTSKIRSRGLGRDTVSVSGPGLVGVAAPVDYVLPIAFGIAVLLGGIVGALVRGLRARRRQEHTSLGLQAIGVVRGVLIGLVAAAAYAVGVNVANVAPPPEFGEAGLFVVAALAALYGIRRPA